jgi:hypothetical protein
MKRLSLPITLTAFLTLSSCSVLNQLNLQPSMLENISALREILNSSTFRALQTLSQLATDDPSKVLPEEFQPVLAGLRTLGLGNEINKITNQVGQISGIVLNESQDIIKESIAKVDFGDAVAIITGGKDAATQVLKNNMKEVVRDRYSDLLSTHLNKTEVNTYWPMAVSAYNIFSKTKVDANLNNFLADKAVDGIFLAMGHEEEEIRKDYKSLGNAVVTKVFDYYAKNQNTSSKPNFGDFKIN